MSSAIDVSCASTTKVSCTNKLASSRSTSRVFEKVKCFSSRLPKPTSSIDGFAGACEVYDESQRRLATGIAIPLGFGAGVFGSLVGVGGGVLIVPAMTATVPIPQRVIVGTSLIAVLATASFASLNFYTAGAVDFVCAAVVGSAAFVFAPLGAMSTAKLNAQSLKRVLAYFLLLAAPLVPLKAYAFDAKSEKKQLAKKKKTHFRIHHRGSGERRFLVPDRRVRWFRERFTGHRGRYDCYAFTRNNHGLTSSHGVRDFVARDVTPERRRAEPAPKNEKRRLANRNGARARVRGWRVLRVGFRR